MSQPINGDSDQAFPKTLRLRTSPEFKQVFSHRCSAADETLVVYARPNGLDRSRLGLSVSRKVGNAVHRTRWKRRIREAFRQRRGQLPRGFDFVALPRRGASPSWQAIDAAVAAVFPRAALRAQKKDQ